MKKGGESGWRKEDITRNQLNRLENGDREQTSSYWFTPEKEGWGGGNQFSDDDGLPPDSGVAEKICRVNRQGSLPSPSMSWLNQPMVRRKLVTITLNIFRPTFINPLPFPTPCSTCSLFVFTFIFFCFKIKNRLPSFPALGFQILWSLVPEWPDLFLSFLLR